MIIYADGVFDLFHIGHLKHLKKIKELYNNSTILIGVISDEVATKYKRKPIINEDDRVKMIKACKYVDKIIKNPPLKINEEFMNKYKIDIVVHAFSNKEDFDKQKNECFEIPIKLNKFKIIEYNKEISTTKIINKWYSESNKLNINNIIPSIVYNDIIKKLDIKKTDRLLEIGCNLIGHLKNICEYYNITNSNILAQKIMISNKVKIYNFYENNMPFHNKFFDKILCYNNIEYFSNKEILNEVERITKHNSKIYFVGIHNNILDTNIFNNYKKYECLFEKNDRYNMYKHK